MPQVWEAYINPLSSKVKARYSSLINSDNYNCYRSSYSITDLSVGVGTKTAPRRPHCPSALQVGPDKEDILGPDNIFNSNVIKPIRVLGLYGNDITQLGWVMDTWLAYAPVKNNPDDAAKVPKGNPYHSATSGEMAIYRANSLILRKAGVKMADPVVDVFNGQEVEVWPRITWKPKWALTYGDVKKKVHEGCYVSQRSTMILNGQNIFLDGLSLDGTIVINAISGAEVKVTGSVQNKGWTLKHIDYKDSSFPEEMRIRGFVIDKVEQLEMNYTEPGKFSLGS